MTGVVTTTGPVFLKPPGDAAHFCSIWSSAMVIF
jgi:hypothetical protein